MHEFGQLNGTIYLMDRTKADCVDGIEMGRLVWAFHIDDVHWSERGPMASCDSGVFAFDVVANDGTRKGQQGWHDNPGALTSASFGKHKQLAKCIELPKALTELARNQAIALEQARFANAGLVGKSGRAERNRPAMTNSAQATKHQTNTVPKPNKKPPQHDG